MMRARVDLLRRMHSTDTTRACVRGAIRQGEFRWTVLSLSDLAKVPWRLSWARPALTYTRGPTLIVPAISFQMNHSVGSSHARRAEAVGL